MVADIKTKIMTKNKKPQTLTNFVNIKSDKDKTFIYIAALLCVGHRAIHSHLFQKNFAVGYNRAALIRDKLADIGVLKKKYIIPKESLDNNKVAKYCVYFVEGKMLEKFIDYCLTENKALLIKDKTLISVGKEALKILRLHKDGIVENKSLSEDQVLISELEEYLPKLSNINYWIFVIISHLVNSIIR